MDIATGYFEIGGLLSLDGQWQKVDNFRILMGDETTRRTRRAMNEAIETAKAALDQSIELSPADPLLLVHDGDRVRLLGGVRTKQFGVIGEVLRQQVSGRA